MKSSSIFIFITIARTAQNSKKKKEKTTMKPINYEFYNKIKKIANFINNQLEGLFLFFFILKTKYIYDFSTPNPTHPKTHSQLQPLQNPQHLTSISNP